MLHSFRSFTIWALGVAISLSAGAATSAEHAAASAEHTAAVEHWRAERLAALTSETGWLTPVALYWLKPGENGFGRASANVFNIDHAALAPDTGSFVLLGKSVRFVAHAAGIMKHGGEVVHEIELKSDRDGEPTELIAGSLHFTLIDRMGNLGVRVKDTVSPQRSNFRGLDYFPIRDDWSIDARFIDYHPVHSIKIVNILGMEENMVSPGAIAFTRGGREWRLDTVLEEPGASELFVMFSDATSGAETYGAGRFLYIGMPSDGRVKVDFNQAHNPPCAFTDFATCPLPPSQNRLSLRIDAGELRYRREHGVHGAP